ncbi:retron Ec67 family RNA-directed DNA polymerase/endonuclease [Streptococcus suis]|uniref:retron Ec67 family RNA-directed DNA polymerase/endonuclease n=1 Tax=Streptococcus suis TaxID=1307 RepID=UPI0020C2430F|nr:retron Ec67 family RNA-directed DNA polymerase/endonuclease [Streptococcus suis]
MFFKEIKDLNHLSSILGIDRNTLNNLLNQKYREKLYETYYIPKKDGSDRQICAPKEPLKSIQKKIAELLWQNQLWVNHKKEEKYIQDKKMLREEKYRIQTFSETLEDINSSYKLTLEIKKDYRFQNDIIQAFEKGKSILTNAEIHRNKKYIIKIDLEDFFDSFTFYRVKGYFEKNRDFQLSKEISMTLANLVCYKSKLPQGAPSSPILTNMIGRILDSRILKICKRYRLKYTRYADDMTFSTNDDTITKTLDDFLSELDNVIENSGFKINEKKTRVSYWNSRQLVTGLVVNKRVNIPREYYKATKGMAHQLYLGNDVHIKGKKIKKPINQLTGRFAFINQVERFNNERTNLEQTEFSSKEKSFQRFLFYKNFYGAEKPVLITEGKTDIRYIRAALKKLHDKHPSLITLEEGGKAKYKLTFFKKSDVIEQYLDLNKHGGSIFEKIWNLYCNNQIFKKKNFNNVYEYFKRIDSKYKSPVIMIFDNELDVKDSPIQQFINKFGSNVKIVWNTEYKENIHVKLQELKQAGKTRQQIDSEIKKFQKDFTENKKTQLITELRKKDYAHLKDNLYLMLIPLVKPNQRKLDIEALPLQEDIEKINQKLGKQFNPSEKEFIEKDNYSKDKLSKQVIYNYQNISFENFDSLFKNVEKIIQHNFLKRVFKK